MSISAKDAGLTADQVNAENTKLTLQNFMPLWLRNARLNASHDMKGIDEWEPPREVAEKDTVVIVAGGPSLYDYRHRLSELNKVAAVAVVPTAMRFCNKWGLRSDFSFIVDANAVMPSIASVARCPIIAANIVDSGIWDGGHELYWWKMYQGHGNFNEPYPAGAWNFATRFFYWHLGLGFVAKGDVVNMAIDITFELIRRGSLGAKRVVLLGVDRAYVDGYDRVGPNMDGAPEGLVPLHEKPVDYVNIDGFESSSRFVYYRRALCESWRVAKWPLYRSDRGMQKEIPQVSFDDIMNGRFPHPYGEDEIVAATSRFLDEILPNEYLSQIMVEEEDE